MPGQAITTGDEQLFAAIESERHRRRESFQRFCRRIRRPDILARSTGVNLLNRSLLSDLLPAQMARGLGLSLLGGLSPLRAFFMREGLTPGWGIRGAVDDLREQVRR